MEEGGRGWWWKTDDRARDREGGGGGSVKTRVCEGNTYAARDEWGRKRRRKEAGRKKSELIVRNGPLRGGRRRRRKGRENEKKRGRYARWKGGEVGKEVEEETGRGGGCWEEFKRVTREEGEGRGGNEYI